MILLFWAIGLLFIGLAIPLIQRRVRPNPLYGLRVAETLENDEVWFEANARSGRDLFWLGVGTILVASGLALLPWSDQGQYALACCAILVVAVLAYAVRGVRMARIVKREVAEAAGQPTNPPR